MPVVIALMGLPGSGKTSVAERLVRTPELSVVSRDVIRAAMFQPCRFTELEKQCAYRALLLAVAACLELGRSCVIDGMTFSRAREVDELRRIVEDAGAHFLPVFLDCPLDVAQARAVRDVADHHRAPEDRDGGLVARVAKRFEAPPADALHLDATRTPEEIAKAILNRLDQLQEP